jgi:hypothetical protein
MSEELPSNNAKDIQPPSEPKESEGADSVQDPAQPPVIKSDQAQMEGPRKILDVLDKQGDAPVSPAPEEKSSAALPQDLSAEADPSAAQQTAEVSDEGLNRDAAAVFSVVQGPLDPEVMISEAMKKLDKILDEIKSGDKE